MSRCSVRLRNFFFSNHNIHVVSVRQTDMVLAVHGGPRGIKRAGRRRPHQNGLRSNTENQMQNYCAGLRRSPPVSRVENGGRW